MRGIRLRSLRVVSQGPVRKIICCCVQQSDVSNENIVCVCVICISLSFATHWVRPKSVKCCWDSEFFFAPTNTTTTLWGLPKCQRRDITLLFAETIFVLGKVAVATIRKSFRSFSAKARAPEYVRTVQVPPNLC